MTTIQESSVPTEEEERHRSIIESALKREGFVAREWRTDPEEDRIEAVLGRFVVTEDDEEHGIYGGDEGEVAAIVVGAQEYSNERVHFGFKADGTDCPTEVPLWNLEDIS